MPCDDGGVPYETTRSIRYDYLVSVGKALEKILNFKYTYKKNTYYVNQIDIDDLVVSMCTFIKNKGDKAEEIIYDGRNKHSRIVADWWDEHKKIDEKRFKKERAAKEKADAKNNRKILINIINEQFKTYSDSVFILDKEKWEMLNVK